MTTTGDLFVNIKGNNKGLKRSLNQSGRDIKTFARDTERQAKNGFGLGDALMLGGIMKSGALAKGMLGVYQKNLGMGGRGTTRLGRSAAMPISAGLLNTDVGQLYGAQLAGRVAMAKDKRTAAAKAMTFEAGRVRARGLNPADTDIHLGQNGTRLSRRSRVLAGRNKQLGLYNKSVALRGALLSATGVITSVAGAVVTGLLAANASKWQKRINKSTEQFSGVVAANKARIQAQNLKRDIRLAQDPTNQQFSMMRQNAANYRANSGNPGFGNAMNAAGAGWDYFIGFMTNALSKTLSGGII